ncbi:hypothetical protein PACTADRAFT_1126 [Pachysolen tannophilus NRRL Y-2460]|uniref:Translocation protein SEC62 n=1 Tax=Pachysolen tannophilus NRRL Y-2460 TaxID=669874 RepID=A0A1E4TXT7_PACTA|nr:hypothetical protein PACTADRAFT_1126 [Pachysolen tannophilus NRRL Y-2460]
MSQLREQQVPVSKEKDPNIEAIASYLRYNKILKQRQGKLNGAAVDFFRLKRCLRALTGEEYIKNSKKYKMPNIDLLNNEKQATQIFIQLISKQLIIPVKKLKTSEAKRQNLKPTKNLPCLINTQKAILSPNEYYCWNFTPPNPWLPFYSILGLIVIFGIVLFPLWPLFLRKGVWYISMLLLGLIGLFFIIAIIRLILYLIILPFGLKFWIFPNLFEDCGFFDSFKPLYGFEGESKKLSKKKLRKSKHPTINNKEEDLGNSSAVKSSQNKKLAKRTNNVTLEEVKED